MTARYNRLRTRPRWKGGLHPGRKRSPEALARSIQKLRRMGFIPVWVDGVEEPIGYIPWYRLN